MDGIALSARYFSRAALPLLRAHFPQIAERCAAGLCAGGLDVGCGSEVYGYDDFLSRDHNWGPRFFLFLSEEDYARHADAVRRMLEAKLSPAFEGLSIAPTTGQATHFHVTTPRRNALLALGVDALPRQDEEWLSIPEAKLAEYAAGAIHYDPLDMVGSLKRGFAAYPPNVLNKRIAGAFFMTHAAGNALRCALRGEWSACRAYLDMTIASVQRAALLLCGRFPPHVKWRGRAFRELPGLPDGWSSRIDSLSIRVDPRTLHEDILAVLLPLGELANASGLIPPQPVLIDSAFLRFNCYGFSKAFEENVQGSLRGRKLAIPLDQMTEGFLPLSAQAVSGQWQAGRPGLSRDILLGQ
jgi:hypothetical protein